MTTTFDTRAHTGTGRSLRARYDPVVAAEFAAQPVIPAAATLTADDITSLQHRHVRPHALVDASHRVPRR